MWCQEHNSQCAIIFFIKVYIVLNQIKHTKTCFLINFVVLKLIYQQAFVIEVQVSLSAVYFLITTKIVSSVKKRQIIWQYYH